MFAFYSSVSRLLSWNKTNTLTSKNTCTSLYPNVTEVKNHLDTMLSPDSSRDVFIAKNDAD